MKKLKFLLCVGTMALCLTACGKGKEDGNSQGTGQSGSTSGEQVGSAGNSQDNAGALGSAGNNQSNLGTLGSAGNNQSNLGASGSVGNGQDNTGVSGSSGLENAGEENQPDGAEGGWSEEMAQIRAAVAEALGDDYWPNMPMDEEMFEQLTGVIPDMYDDYMAESPMISANVDTLVIVRAKEGMADTVEETLNAYRDRNVNETMQYPMNVGKIQASQVARMGDYVVFVQLGADPFGINDEDVSNEDVIKKCREVNGQVIEIIRQYVEP